jgi:lipid-binding SYLF domain-containing protein
MPETAWEKTKKYSGTAYSKALKPGFDKAYQVVDKLGAPINRLSNKLGAEAFWPTSLDKESDKAARILRSFCKDGFYTGVDEDQAQKVAASGEKLEGPQGKQRVLKKIPEKVIREAKGLAIFTTMRTGLWVSGAGGSGILVARNQQTGEWSPPSGIMLHTAGLGFLVGVDIYDCVVVINTYKALEAFTKIRCTLGGEVSAVAGPVGLGGVLETELHKRQAPVWTYLKSRGFYAGVQVDGTIIIERTDENEIFYGERIPVADILAGKAKNAPKAKYRMLMETIKAAQGDRVDESELPAAGLAPGDLQIEIDSKLSDGTFRTSESDFSQPVILASQTSKIQIRMVSKPCKQKALKSVKQAPNLGLAQRCSSSSQRPPVRFIPISEKAWKCAKEPAAGGEA